MADAEIWGPDFNPIATPAASDRIIAATGPGAGGYSERGEFVWRNALGKYIHNGASPNYAINFADVNPARGIIADFANNGVSGLTGAMISFTQNTINNWCIGQAPGADAFAFYQGRNGASDGAEILRITSSSIGPGSDGSVTGGSVSLRYSTLYAVTGAINTCDFRFKTFRTDHDLRAAEHAAALALFDAFGFYQFNDAIAAKGEDGARWHFGPAAQEAYSIWADHGLCDPLIENDRGELIPPPGAVPPAFMCFDLIKEETAPVTEGWRPSAALVGQDGQPVMVKCAEGEEATEQRPTGETVVTREAGHIFGVRIDQLHSIMLAALNAERKAQAAAIAALQAAA